MTNPISDLTAQTTVAEAIAHSPRALRVFDVLGIDYCCHADRSLSDAAAAAGLEVEELRDLITHRIDEQPAATADWTSAPLRQLTWHIIDQHHRRTRRLIVDLVESAAQAVSGHAEGHPFLWKLRDAIDRLIRDLVPHMAKEEKYLFPYIDSMQQSVAPDETILIPLCGTVDHPLQSIRHDHSRDLETMEELRNLIPELLRTSLSCQRCQLLAAMLQMLDADLNEHVRLENDILFPRAVELERKLARPRK